MVERRCSAAQNGREGIWALAPVVENPETSGEFITLARVVKTQGRRGEVAAEVHSDVPDRFAVGMKLFALLSKRGGAQGRKRIAESDPVTEIERVEVKIDDLWPHKGLLILKFVGVDSISDAEALIGSELQVPRSDRAELERDWTYVSDLIGCAVLDHGREIGRIEDVQFGAGQAPLLIVASAGKGGEVVKYDVPFAEAYLEKIDAVRHEVRMNLPEGILEVNAPVTTEEKREQLSSKRKKNT